MSETTLKGFDQPDEVREFTNGRFQIVHIAGVSLGRATVSVAKRGHPSDDAKSYAPHGLQRRVVKSIATYTRR